MGIEELDLGSGFRRQATFLSDARKDMRREMARPARLASLRCTRRRNHRRQAFPFSCIIKRPANRLLLVRCQLSFQKRSPPAARIWWRSATAEGPTCYQAWLRAYRSWASSDLEQFSTSVGRAACGATPRPQAIARSSVSGGMRCCADEFKRGAERLETQTRRSTNLP